MVTKEYSQINRLHTENLRKIYGGIHAVVYRHNAKFRITGLLDEKGITRTHALVLFPSWTDISKFKRIDKGLRKGELLGETFKNKGYKIRKNVIGILNVKLPTWLKRKFRTTKKKAKARITEFYVKKKSKDTFIYGIVIEIYSPAFCPLKITREERSTIIPPTKNLNKIGISKNKIWNNIKTNKWDKKSAEFQLAKKASRKELQKIETKLKTYLKKKSL